MDDHLFQLALGNHLRVSKQGVLARFPPASRDDRHAMFNMGSFAFAICAARQDFGLEKAYMPAVAEYFAAHVDYNALVRLHAVHQIPEQ
jgi:hypothetical protein